MRECLEASGALVPVRFLASLHRRRFAEVIRRHPGNWPGSLDKVVQIRELALAMAAHAGAASVTPLACASKATRTGIGGVLSEFPAWFPSHVYAIGGADVGTNALATVERFDSTSCAWRPAPSMNQPRTGCAAVTSNGVIYVLGGVSSSSGCLASVECFRPQISSVWESLPPMRCARSAASAVAVGGMVYVVGGRDGFQSLDSLERFDPVHCFWDVLPPLHSARFGAAAAVLSGQIYVVGGKNGGRVFDSVERLNVEPPDLTLSSWELMPPLHARRYRTSAATAHGRVYVAGGCDGSWQTGLRSVERFDPDTVAWSMLSPLQIPRWGAAAVHTGGSICVLGGRSDGGAMTSVERHDLATGTWEPMPHMLTARKFCAAAACQG